MSCECEHGEHQSECRQEAWFEVRTVFGTFALCVDCYGKEHGKLSLSDNEYALIT